MVVVNHSVKRISFHDRLDILLIQMIEYHDFYFLNNTQQCEVTLNNVRLKIKDKDNITKLNGDLYIY